jgi:hypothetical protein
MVRVLVAVWLGAATWLWTGAAATRASGPHPAELARATADRFLAAVALAASPEGKRALAETSWAAEPPPALVGSKLLLEAMFDTDVPGVRGYKRLLQVTLRSKGGTHLSSRYLLVAYQDGPSGPWRVLGFGEAKDFQAELKAAREGLGDTRYHKDQLNYRRYGQWAALAGSLQAALEAHRKAADLNRSDPDPTTPQQSFDESVAVLARIAGRPR